ncbi:uncharacterized protein Z518_00651 [Rhinocladiella mackenziei CBS 650.93]|uniref:Major facilitator superfamily (MFS) profile domain-containing protein n=1 Tax=Rhinocladiella mackenziei CBS 650.93 TaxID=1442369 RepID=A0A0D2J1M3_9EURO|nr:uncharacterized protein Z518_00651 [Rhinocladiella mackenziei CBS 650.93]KIX09571.1 hypothetical protein Z518_00651 [Rhinocladiella mackenziei CBS 650.93]
MSVFANMTGIYSSQRPAARTNDMAGHTDKNLPEVTVKHAHGNLWTTKGAIIAYIILVVTTFVINLDISTTRIYIPFATSDFQAHSLLTTANVIAKIADIAAYPVVAKLSDIFGRAEGVAISILFQVLGNVLRAASENIHTYAAAAIFYSAGLSGYSIVQQIFIADTTKLINRGFWGSLVEAITVIPVLYIGTTIGEQMILHSTWRWGYGMWTIIVPVAAIPLIVIIYIHQRRGMRAMPPAPKVSHDVPLAKRVIRSILIDFDLPGGILLVAGLALLLIPLTLTGTSETQRWDDGSTIAMLVIGILLLIAFCVWDAKFAKHPFMPYATFTERTIIGAYALSLLDWLGLSILQTFLTSWAMVAGGMSPSQAGRLEQVNTTRVTFQVGSVFVGLLMRYAKRSQPFVLAGVPISLLGQGIFIHLVKTSSPSSAKQAAFVTSRVLYGIGKGLFSTAAQISCQALVGPKQVAVVTGVFFAMQSIGGVIGIAISGVIWNKYLPRKLEAYLPLSAQSQIPAIFKSFKTAMEYPEGEPIREAINRSYRETEWILSITGTAITALMIIIMFFLKNVNLEEADAQRLKELEAESPNPRSDSVSGEQIRSISVNDAKL